jgi:hypothetical protein
MWRSHLKEQDEKVAVQRNSRPVSGFHGGGLIVCDSSINRILIQIFDEMAAVTAAYKRGLQRVPVSKASTKRRDSDLTCCFTQA